jgi:CDGSH-type Zn-finger protein
MQEKFIKNQNPTKVHLEKDKDYYWCACGLSKDGTFCDGSHSKS